MFKSLIKAVFGDPNLKEIKKFSPIVDEINALEPEMQAKSDEDLREMMAHFRRDLREQTHEERTEVQTLRREVTTAVGKERQQLQIQLERAEKNLLKLEMELLDDILPEVFAAVREASRRTIGLRHYDVQLVGGAIIHQGKVVEMRTGEGKTLVATAPVVLNALMGRGVHVITVNDYLAKRDCQWMGPIYHRLGLSIGVIQNAGGQGVDQASFQYDPDYHSDDDRFEYLRPITRKQAYACDITYGTNNEFGFDYLRDNMVTDLERVTQRELHYAIIDEVDNILIDEARTPLIISGQAEESSEMYRTFAQLVRPLRRSSDESVTNEDMEPDGDYVVDEKSRISYLTEAGIEKIERALGVENLYEGESAALTPYLDNALRAHALYKLDVDYVVQNGEVIIVDDFTGRLMHGRRYSEGLHQAIEAKEGVKVQNESFTWATITFQNLFRMYNKLAGMTGTAETEAEELGDIYKLEVMVLPTNVEYRSMQGELVEETAKESGVSVTTYRNDATNEFYYKRVDYADQVYKNPQGKFKAVVNEIKQMQAEGRPVLVGTIAIETSEHLATLLNRAGVKHEVLNAKQHEREASIITQAGRPGAVTIATNMAGRGVDILLGGNPEGLARDELRRQGIDLTEVDPDLWKQTLNKWTQIVAKDRQTVKELGGLHVIGTERHDARRIDNQLRGRAGRQGDPGSSRFYVSLQDDLMRRFGGQNVASLMERFGVEDDIPIEAGIVSKSIENSQTKVEGHNFDIRKQLIKYDDVVNQQREVMYAERRRILSSDSVKESIQNMIDDHLSAQVATYTTANFPEEWDLHALMNGVKMVMPLPETVTTEAWSNMARDEIEEQLLDIAEENYERMEAAVGSEELRKFEKRLMLQVLDTLWVRHLTALDALRQGIGLRAIAQQDPLVSYQKEGFAMYGQLRDNIKVEVVHRAFRPTVMIQQAPQPKNVQAIHPSAEAASSSNVTAETAGSSPEAPQPVRVSKTPGRNDLCYCGSGKKYKHCHEKLDRVGANGSPGPRSAKAGKPNKAKRR
ncbi:MAG TPA: preprotein translocase subunit SecA [Anaerolineae bacterium]|nr:preprotein translocase subunit SecA [Anaerolineae bacterium]HMR62651.1 preprotein translocase subunit SecA [Anaerolineae bacterium]